MAKMSPEGETKVGHTYSRLKGILGRSSNISKYIWKWRKK